MSQRIIGGGVDEGAISAAVAAYSQANPPQAGRLLQLILSERADTQTGNILIPDDASVPQISEGVEFLSASVTPKMIGSVLMVEASLWIGEESNHSNTLTCGLFRDSSSDAISVDKNLAIPVGGSLPAINRGRLNVFHSEIAAALNPILFTVRGGGDGGGSIRLNGASGIHYPAIKSFVRIMELSVD